VRSRREGGEREARSRREADRWGHAGENTSRMRRDEPQPPRSTNSNSPSVRLNRQERPSHVHRQQRTGRSHRDKDQE
jgi:hypothetical protein